MRVHPQQRKADGDLSLSLKKFLAIGASIVAILAGLLTANYLLAPRAIQLASGTLLNEPRELPDFLLTDQSNHFLHKDDFAGHWTLIFPGFTYCPDVCPTTLAFLKQLSAALGPESAQLKVLFLSVDPERDTPQRLNEYIRFFSPDFIAATTGEPMLTEFARNLGVVYTKVPGDKPDTYSMDHSAVLILIDPQVRIAAYFTPPHSLKAMTTDLRALITSKP